MKKLLAVLLSLCLVVGMLPMMAFADGDGGDTERGINGGGEPTLLSEIKNAESLEAAINSATVDPVVISDNIPLGNDFTISKGVTIKSADDNKYALRGSIKIVASADETVKLENVVLDANVLVESGTLDLTNADVTNVSISLYGGEITGLTGYEKACYAGDSTGRVYYTNDISTMGVAYIEGTDQTKTVYSDLNSALTAAADGKTVTLCDDVSGDFTVPARVKLIVPVGVTVTGNVSPKENVTNNGTITGWTVTEPEPDPVYYTVTFDVYPRWATVTVTDANGANVTVKNNSVTLEEGKVYNYRVSAPGFVDGTGEIRNDGDIRVWLSLSDKIVIWPYSHGYVEYWISHSRDWAGVRVEPDSGYYLDDLTIYKVGGGTVNYGHWRDNIYYFPLYAGEQYIIDADFASAPSEYRVYVDSSILHGDVSVDTVYAEEGEWVYITVDPDVGYRLYNLTVTRPSGNTVKVEHVRDNVYRFSMPGVRVTVDAEFIRTVTPFTDVRLADWFYEYVSFAYRYGLMEGINSYQFAPDATATRAMVVQILYRMSGEPAVSYGSGFTDVASNAWYADAIAWAARNNIVNGTSAATFDPNAPVTREQFATMLYRYARYRGFNTSLTANILSYYDVNQVSEYAFEALQWACAEGIVNGTSTGYLTPQGNATRAQLAAMLMRFCTEYFDL